MEMEKRKFEIAFLDCETIASVAIIEFAAVVLCHRTLQEVDRFESFVKPKQEFLARFKDRKNGIEISDLEKAQTFRQLHKNVFRVLHGRIWAGHSINNSDIPRLKEAFADIKKPMPKCAGIIDTCELFRRIFTSRGGNNELQSVANYLSLGKQLHRSMSDVMLNIEALKECATILFVEGTFPALFPKNSWTSPPKTRSRGKIEDKEDLTNS